MDSFKDLQISWKAFLIVTVGKTRFAISKSPMLVEANDSIHIRMYGVAETQLLCSKITIQNLFQ